MRLHLEAHLADLVEEDRPLVGELEPASPVAWPNNSVSRSVSAIAAQLTATKGR
jgi:hypothetical protein